MSLSEVGLTRLFKLLEGCAVRGERCPMAAPHGPLQKGSASGFGVLARQGRIRVEVYPHNYRVVEIRQGHYRGARTAAPPNAKWRPYKVIPDDLQRPATPPAPAQRRPPSKPTVLTESRAPGPASKRA